MLQMSDPRNVAHDKKVTQEKHHQKTEAAPAAKRVPRDKKVTASEEEKAPGKNSPPEEAPKTEQGSNDHEKAVAILSKLKDMEFHSRANIETLAQLTLTIEEDLKQREFSEAMGSVYSAQDAFHSKIATLIEAYAVKCDAMKGTA
jgi:hypothetical protein